MSYWYRQFVTAIIVLLIIALSAYAASHREAPLIPGATRIDVADTYAFVSYESGRSSMVTLMANFIPLQEGEPNAFKLDANAHYDIHIDNTGDGQEDLRFRLQFKLVPPANTSTQRTQHPHETYSLALYKKNGASAPLTRKGNQSTSFDKPADYTSRRAMPDYAAYALKHRYDINVPGCAKSGRVFVGQRLESLHLDIGEVSNLLRQAMPPADQPKTKSNSIGEQQNVITWALEIPAACLVAPGDTVIGVWSTVSQVPPLVTAQRSGSAGYSQVARMGMPLVNEVIIGAADIDKYPMSEPKDDAANGFLKYFHQVTPYPMTKSTAPVNVRADMEAAFLQGIPNLNQFKNPSAKAEMLRLNTAIAPTPPHLQNPLGSSACFSKGALTIVSGCDRAGFPNGRRPGDDVVNIVLQIARGGVLSANPAPANYRAAPRVTARQLSSSFPYLQNPLPDKAE